MTKIASIIFEDTLQKNNLFDSTKIVNSVHDEIVCECPKDNAEIVKQILQESMIQAAKLFVKELPLKAEAFVGDNWGIKS